jgi:hypothetical protein
MRTQVLVLIATFILASVCWGQQSNNGQSSGQGMPAMDMSGHDMSKMNNPQATGDKDENDSETGVHVMNSMEGHMDMGPHMKMTELRPARPGDAERARQIVDTARKTAEKYIDYHVALNDGFKIFFPNVPQKVYHFTNYSYGRENALKFNPEHPTSLLYEKHGDDYKLVGVMYTAPKHLTEDELNQRIPLSIAQWHEHVNFCIAPFGHREEYFGPNAKFGLKGSIATEEACTAAGGTFRPVVFNWMVHVYPFEKDQAAIWSVDRQHGDGD